METRHPHHTTGPLIDPHRVQTLQPTRRPRLSWPSRLQTRLLKELPLVHIPAAQTESRQLALGRRHDRDANLSNLRFAEDILFHQWLTQRRDHQAGRRHHGHNIAELTTTRHEHKHRLRHDIESAETQHGYSARDEHRDVVTRRKNQISWPTHPFQKNAVQVEFGHHKPPTSVDDAKIHIGGPAQALRCITLLRFRSLDDDTGNETDSSNNAMTNVEDDFSDEFQSHKRSYRRKR